MSGLEVLGAVSAVLDLVSRASIAFAALRLSRTNPAQCDRVRENLCRLRGHLERAQSADAACLGRVWLDALSDVRAAVQRAVDDLEEAAGTRGARRPGARRAWLTGMREVTQAVRVKELLDDVETRSWWWWNRLCAVDGAVQSEGATRKILEAVEKVEGETTGRNDSKAMRKDIRDMKALLAKFSAVLTPEVLAGLMVLQGNPPACLDALQRIMRQAEEVDAGEGLSGDNVEAVSVEGSFNTGGGGSGFEFDPTAGEELRSESVLFLQQLKRGEVGACLSEEERRDAMVFFENLPAVWRPWEVDTSGLVFDVRKSGRQYQIGASFFRASWDILEGAKVAVKILRHDQCLVSSELKVDFYRECLLLYRLRHPSIVQFYGARWPELGPSTPRFSEGFGNSEEEDGDGESEALLVMELMDGDIGAWLAKEGGSLREKDDVVRSLLHVAEALEFIHGQNIVHFAVEPSNVLVRVCGGRLIGRAKLRLRNFGLSRQKQAKSPSLCASHLAARVSAGGRGASFPRVGTAAYMAPEMLACSLRVPGGGEGSEGDSSFSSSCDVYSFGVTLVFLMCLMMGRDAGDIPELFGWSEVRLAVAADIGALSSEISKWIDRVLGSVAGLKEVALACVQPLGSQRPSISCVAKALRLLVCDGRAINPARVASVRAVLAGEDISKVGNEPPFEDDIPNMPRYLATPKARDVTGDWIWASVPPRPVQPRQSEDFFKSDRSHHPSTVGFYKQAERPPPSCHPPGYLPEGSLGLPFEGNSPDCSEYGSSLLEQQQSRSIFLNYSSPGSVRPPLYQERRSGTGSEQAKQVGHASASELYSGVPFSPPFCPLHGSLRQYTSPAGISSTYSEVLETSAEQASNPRTAGFLYKSAPALVSTDESTPSS